MTNDESIRVFDKVMVVLSRESIQSPWVEDEVEAALERERKDKDKRVVLFPIRLDDEVMDTNQAWAASLRRTSATSATGKIMMRSRTGSTGCSAF